MVNKGKGTKQKKIVKKGKGKKILKKKKPAKDDESTLANILNEADQAVLITTHKGNVQITGLKAINYAYEVKGLLMGGLDTYTNRPIMTGLNNNARAIISHLVNINGKIDKIVAEIEEPEEVAETKEEKETEGKE